MKKLTNKNIFARRPPSAAEIRKARELAKKVSARLYAMFEAREVKRDS